MPEALRPWGRRARPRPRPHAAASGCCSLLYQPTRVAPTEKKLDRAAYRLPTHVQPRHDTIALNAWPDRPQFRGRLTVEIDVLEAQRITEVPAQGAQLSDARVTAQDCMRAGDATLHPGHEMTAQRSCAGRSLSYSCWGLGKCPSVSRSSAVAVSHRHASPRPTRCGWRWPRPRWRPVGCAQSASSSRPSALFSVGLRPRCPAPRRRRSRSIRYRPLTRASADVSGSCATRTMWNGQPLGGVNEHRSTGQTTHQVSVAFCPSATASVPRTVTVRPTQARGCCASPVATCATV
jgi:hypothetical protein